VRAALIALVLSIPALGAEPPSLRMQPQRLVNGSAFLVTLRPAQAWRAARATLDDERIFLDREADGTWSGLGGVGFDAKPGRHELVVHAQLESGKEGREGKEERFALPLDVEHAIRPRSQLQVPKQYVEPDPRILARVEREKKIKAELLTKVTTDRLFSGPFEPPVTVETSEGYGIERVFNGKRQSVHYGLDYRAPSGTPVSSINGGRVLMARDFFYEGRCVAVDHGRGLITLYLHLSKIEVKEGDRVEKGQRLGLSGGTGRATGPHLHLAVRWQGLYLDPITLLALAPR